MSKKSKIMNLSVVMIVKDVEQTIAECLLSFIDHVDEVVIVDTGSTDDTLDILNEFANRYDNITLDYFEWIDDFSAARNYALSLATCSWAMWIDADDVVTGAEHLRSIINNPKTTSGIILPYQFDDKGAIKYPMIRLFKNNYIWKWEYPIHEVLMRGNDDSPLSSSDKVTIHHRRPAIKESGSLERNLRIHKKYFDECRTKHLMPDARSCFYFARDLRSTGKYEDAIFRFTQSISREFWTDQKYQSHHFIADCFRSLQRYGDAIDFDVLAAIIYPEWPDAYFGIAESHFYQCQWNESIFWNEVGRQKPRPETSAIINDNDYTFWPHNYDAWSYFNLSMYDKCIESANKALVYQEEPSLRKLIKEAQRK